MFAIEKQEFLFINFFTLLFFHVISDLDQQ
jgi:hypothetical protein